MATDKISDTSPPGPEPAQKPEEPATEPAKAAGVIIVKTTWAKTVASYRWPLALMVICLIAYFVWRKTTSGVTETVKDVTETVATITAKFRTGTITTTFTAAIPELSRDGARLELKTLTGTENFRRSDEKRIIWDLVSLGTTVSEIKVTVTYRYHLRLNAPWRLKVRGHSCLVYAPLIRASLPPAIHTDKLEKKTANGWLRFNAAEQMQELEKSLTPILNGYAADAKHISLVRESCRQAVAEFVRAWLLKEDHWRTDRFSSIQVIFADEIQADEEPRPEPTVTLEGDGK